MKIEKIAFWVITFEPIKIQTHSAPQNLNFSFVKDIHVDGWNLAWNSCKTAICQCTFFLLALYLPIWVLVSVSDRNQTNGFCRTLDVPKTTFEISWLSWAYCSNLYTVPAVNLDNMAIGVTDKDPDIMAWTNPGASLSITILVASGVTSLGANPVPPKTEILALWKYNKNNIQWILRLKL